MRPTQLEDGPIVTSAGTAAAIDACLHLVRQSYGAATANALARRLVAPAHRTSGQAQLIQTPVPTPASSDLSELPQLGPTTPSRATHRRPTRYPTPTCHRERLPVDSPRPPAPPRTNGSSTSACCWGHLLEDSEMTIEQVAVRCGLGSPTPCDTTSRDAPTPAHTAAPSTPARPPTRYYLKGSKSRPARRPPALPITAKTPYAMARSPAAIPLCGIAVAPSRHVTPACGSRGGTSAPPWTTSDAEMVTAR